MSQLGVLSGMANSQSRAEHWRGRGGAMLQADLFDHFTGVIIDSINDQ